MIGPWQIKYLVWAFGDSPLSSQRTTGKLSIYGGFSQNEGYHFGGSYSNDYSILGSILGSFYVGKLSIC